MAEQRSEFLNELEGGIANFSRMKNSPEAQTVYGEERPCYGVCDCGAKRGCTCPVHEYWYVYTLDHSRVKGLRKFKRSSKEISNMGLSRSL